MKQRFDKWNTKYRWWKKSIALTAWSSAIRGWKTFQNNLKSDWKKYVHYFWQKSKLFSNIHFIFEIQLIVMSFWGDYFHEFCEKIHKSLNWFLIWRKIDFILPLDYYYSLFNKRECTYTSYFSKFKQACIKWIIRWLWQFQIISKRKKNLNSPRRKGLCVQLMILSLWLLQYFNL